MTGKNFLKRMPALLHERAVLQQGIKDLQQRIDEIDKKTKQLLAQHLRSKPGKYEEHSDGTWSLRETNVTEFPK